MPAAANTVTPETEKRSPAGSPSKRANPVALEVVVSVTAARANNGGARELFTEETQTVLVFPDGAVIRLVATVALGQLLFLTNKRNNTEVVCQVLNTRALGPAGAYVELQFTDAKPDFWGVSFALAEKGEPEFSRKEQVEAQETTQAAPAAVVQPHKTEDVDQLKQEVEALRKQLMELEKKRAAESGKVESGPSMAKLVAGFAPPQAAPEVPSKREPAASAGTGGDDAPLMPSARETKEPGRAVVGMTLPIGRAESRAAMEGRDPAEDLLPKPELDFSQMPIEMVNGVRSAYRARHTDIRKVMAPGLVVLMMVLGVSLWMMKPWRYFGGGKTSAPVSAPAKAVKPVSLPSKTDTGSGATGIAVNASDKPTDAAQGAGENGATENGTATNGSGRGDPGDGSRAGEETSKKREGPKGRNSDTIELGTAADRNPGVLPVNDAPVLPAKLVKAANPVYPPDAMRRFITGDVRAEVMVEADGRIGEIKVLAGPKPLRAAAVEALKQYQYAPATQGGKGVASRVTTTVKFWFNP